MKHKPKLPTGVQTIREPVTKEVTLPQRVMDDFSHHYPGVWKLTEMVRKHPEQMIGKTWVRSFWTITPRHWRLARHTGSRAKPRAA